MSIKGEKYSSKKQMMKHERFEGKAERKMEYGPSKGKKSDYSSKRKSC
jgi:hypothetical protein